MGATQCATIDRFPHLEKLMRAVHDTFSRQNGVSSCKRSATGAAKNNREYGRHGLNAIVRRYMSGDRLVFHADRPWLQEQIYGVVLHCEDGKAGLMLGRGGHWASQDSYAPWVYEEEYRIPEQIGA